MSYSHVMFAYLTCSQGEPLKPRRTEYALSFRARCAAGLSPDLLTWPCARLFTSSRML